MRSTIVITGVTRGLGRALAEQFSFLGHTVIGCGRNKDILKKMSKSLGNIFLVNDLLKTGE